MKKSYSVALSILFAILPVAVVGVTGALLVDTESAWYMALQKPAINPPPWAFSAAWSLVYLCVAISLYLLLLSTAPVAPGCLAALVVAGVLNIAWSLVFFRLYEMVAAAVVLGALVAALIYAFACLWHDHRASAWLLVPHILWGTFAFVLNLSFIAVNMP